MQLIPLELVKSNRDSVRKTREANLIERGQTLEPHGLKAIPIRCFVSHRPPSREGGSVGRAKKGMNT